MYYFKKYLFSSLTIILVYNTCFCESGVHEISENNILGFRSSDVESVFLKNGLDTILNLHNNADEEECKCENGRCEVVCADWSLGACIRTKQECVCDPEFGKYDDKTCIYCKCGKGFNCTINRNNPGDIIKCNCPEGYYDYGGECAAFCNKNRPCLNGGECRNGKCECNTQGSTWGPFCERIFRCATECRARLTVDCVWNLEYKWYECLCKNRSLVFDDTEWICKPCPCGEGTCEYDKYRQNLHCNCKPGYYEFQKQCRKCDCGPGHGCEINRSGEKICKCKKGFFAREGTCLPCECGHKEATCTLDSVNRKICNCPEGYQDNFGICEKMKGNCTCHPSAICIETDDGFECECQKGYMGKHDTHPKPGEACTDLDECTELEKDPCPRFNNQKCINFPGSYMCQCLTGYEPMSMDADNGKLICQEYKVSWLPTGLTIGVIVAFIVVSVGFIMFLKHRASARTTTGIEMRHSR